MVAPTLAAGPHQDSFAMATDPVNSMYLLRNSITRVFSGVNEYETPS